MLVVNLYRQPARQLSRWARVTSLAACCLLASHAAQADISTQASPSLFKSLNFKPSSETSALLTKPHTIKDLAYGEFLFSYFQEQPLQALTQALIADQHDRLKHHGAQVKVLTAKLLLDYGLLNQAERIFLRLLKQVSHEKQRQQIWLQLAQLQYKAGDYDKSNQIIRQHLPKPEAALIEPVNLLAALNHLGLQQLDKALLKLQQIEKAEQLSIIARLNLGMLLVRLNQPAAAQRHLQTLLELKDIPIASLSIPTSEAEPKPIEAGNQQARQREKQQLLAAIKDRAALALGKLHLQTGQFALASASFKKIRLHSEASNLGLLGLGWAQLKADQPNSALTPWSQLLAGSPQDPAVQEVYANIPYVYEKLGANRTALQGYQQAKTFYQQEQQRLNALQQQVSSSAWVAALIPEEKQLKQSFTETSPFKAPHNDNSVYFYRLFASHEFQRSYQHYRQLQSLQHLLNDWHTQLPLYNQMLDAQSERLSELSPRAEHTLKQANSVLKFARQQLKQLRQQLKQAVVEDDDSITADQKQLVLLDSIKRLEKQINQLPNDFQYRPIRERFKLVKGLLLWDLNASAISRRWRGHKNAALIQEQVGLLEQNITQVNAALQQQRQSEDLRPRITAAKQHLLDLFARTETALNHQQQHIQSLAMAEIKQRQIHIQRLQANSLYAIARLQDLGFSQDRAEKIRMLGEPETAAPATPQEPIIRAPSQKAEAKQDSTSASGADSSKSDAGVERKSDSDAKPEKKAFRPPKRTSLFDF